MGGRGWFRGHRAAGKRDQLPEKKCTGLVCSSVLQQLGEVCFVYQGEDSTVCVPQSFKARAGMVTDFMMRLILFL